MVSTVPMDAKGQPVRPGVNGGLMRRQRPDQPPVNYINVESVDEYTKKGTRLGAEQIMPKTPVKGMGWFRAVSSPSGHASMTRACSRVRTRAYIFIDVSRL